MFFRASLCQDWGDMKLSVTISSCNLAPVSATYFFCILQPGTVQANWWHSHGASHWTLWCHEVARTSQEMLLYEAIYYSIMDGNIFFDLFKQNRISGGLIIWSSAVTPSIFCISQSDCGDVYFTKIHNYSLLFGDLRTLYIHNRFDEISVTQGKYAFFCTFFWICIFCLAIDSDGLVFYPRARQG